MADSWACWRCYEQTTTAHVTDGDCFAAMVRQRDHSQAALERIVFVHSDDPEVSAWDLSEIAGEALDSRTTSRKERSA